MQDQVVQSCGQPMGDLVLAPAGLTLHAAQPFSGHKREPKWAAGQRKVHRRRFDTPKANQGSPRCGSLL